MFPNYRNKLSYFSLLLIFGDNWQALFMIRSTTIFSSLNSCGMFNGEIENFSKTGQDATILPGGYEKKSPIKSICICHVYNNDNIAANFYGHKIWVFAVVVTCPSKQCYDCVEKWMPMLKSFDSFVVLSICWCFTRLIV